MDVPDRDAIIAKGGELLAACEEIEAEAGITAEIERAHEGRFIPLGALPGERKVSPKEYFADEYDYTRDGMRDAYFSVPDPDLRKKLIAARRTFEEHDKQLDALPAAEAAKELAELKRKREPWGLSAIGSVVAVGIGYQWFGLPGAMAGAVAAVFLGFGYISSWRRAAATAVEQAQAALDQERADAAEQARMPDTFGLHEALTGERDKRLDQESAYANVLQSVDGP